MLALRIPLHIDFYHCPKEIHISPLLAHFKNHIKILQHTCTSDPYLGQLAILLHLHLLCERVAEYF